MASLRGAGCGRSAASAVQVAQSFKRDRGEANYADCLYHKETAQLVNLAHKFSLFSEQWQPKVVAEMNDYQFKVVRIAGDFIWHSHPETDETLMVVEGVLRVDFRDGHVLVKAGEMIVVPRGVEHKTSAETEAKLMLIEPRGVLNTGHEGGERTAVNDVWI